VGVVAGLRLRNRSRIVRADVTCSDIRQIPTCLPEVSRAVGTKLSRRCQS
jgi:hypothetical protein